MSLISCGDETAGQSEGDVIDLARSVCLHINCWRLSVCLPRGFGERQMLIVADFSSVCF